MVKDMLHLRILAICGALCGIVYALFYTDVILWVDLIWETGFVAINSFHVVILARERFHFSLTDEEMEIYRVLFSNMPVFEFRRLILAGEWKNFSEGEVVIRENEHVSIIAIISSGHADIIAGGRTVAQCGKGALLGEMSFVTGETASATVQASEPMRCVVWEHSNVRHIIDSNEILRQGFQSALSENLIRKLQRHKEKPPLPKGYSEV